MLSPEPVVVPPNPKDDRVNRTLPEPQSAPRNKRGHRMRHGAGMPVPFPVCPKSVFAELKRAVTSLGVSLSSVVAGAPLRTFRLCELQATQPTVDPKVVEQFVAHPDSARVGNKRHKDGRLLDVPLIVTCGGCKYIYDGHHRCVAALIRGDEEIIARCLSVEGIAKMAATVVHAKSKVGSDALLGSDGKPPKEFRIFAFGDFDTSKGCFQFDKRAAKSVLAFYEEQGNELSVDYEHMAVCDPPVIAPAAGFFKLELRDDGLWAVEVRWTERAAEMLEHKEYRYFSPAFAVDKESGRITKLLNIALTNIPATKNMKPLVEARMRLGSTLVMLRHGVFGKSRKRVIAGARVRLEEIKVEARMTAKRRYTRGIVFGLAKGGFTIQSLIFPKAHWTKQSAKRWAKDHDFAPGVDETSKSFRFRQRDPENFEKLATICLTPSGSKAADASCKIKAVGGPLKKKAKASAEAVAEPIAEAAQTANQEDRMARKERTKKAEIKVAASAPATPKSNVPKAQLFDKNGAEVDQDTNAAEVAAKTGVTPAVKAKAGATKANQVTATADSGDSGDSDSDSDSDSDDSDAAEMAAGEADSGDSGDSDSEDSDDEAAEMAADSEDDSEDSEDSDSDSDSDDSDDEEASAAQVAAKKTPTVPDTEVPAAQTASQRSKGKKKGSVTEVVASLTGTRKRGEQIARLHALEDSRDELKKLSAKFARLEAREEKQKIVRIVDRAIEKMRLPPAKREKAIKLAEKHGIVVLRDYISALPKRGMVDRETSAAKDGDVSVKLVSARLTKEDREVMAKFDLSEEDYVATRMAQSTKQRTGQGRLIS